MIAIDCIGKLKFIMLILTRLVYYVRILVPILLIVFIVFDLAKVVVGNADDKVKKDAFNKAAKRLIYAIIVFLVPTIINFAMNRLAKLNGDDVNGNPTTWYGCWQHFYNQQ